MTPSQSTSTEGARASTREEQRGTSYAISDLLDIMSRTVRGALLLPVRFYRRFLSRLKPVSTCRFTPTCSAYAEEALRTHGVFRALTLTIWRLLRCQPFAKAGHDPVPPPRSPSAPANRSTRP